MKKIDFLGIRIISYYNLIVSFFFIFGSIVLVVFSKTKYTSSEKIYLFPFLFLLLAGLFYAFSALKYLQQQKIGRVCLICSCVIQILFSIQGLIITFKSIASLPFVNIIMLLVSLWKKGGVRSQFSTDYH